MIQILTTYGGLLLAAMGQTLLLALCGLFFACILGLIFGLLSVVKNRACNIISIIFVDAIRGVPMIVLAFYIYLGIPALVNRALGFNGFTLTALQAGLKDTSILSVIGFPELVNTAKNVVANSFKVFEVWTIVAIMYLIVITALSVLAKKVERRLNRGRE